MNIEARLHAVERLAHRCFAASAAGAAAGTSYAAAMAIVAELFAYLAQLEAGLGDAAKLRLGPHDLSLLRSRRMPLTNALEIIAGMGASAERDERRAALARLESLIEDIRIALGLLAV